MGPSRRDSGGDYVVTTDGNPTTREPGAETGEATAEAVLRPEAGRVLVVLMDHHLGNLVLSLPIARALATYFANPVDVVVDARWAPLVAQLPNVGRLYHYPARRKDWLGRMKTAGRVVGLWSSLFARRYRAVVDLTGHIRGTGLCLATGARTRVGLSSSRRAWVYTHRYDRPADGHMYDCYAALLRCIGRTERPEPIRLTASPESHRRVAAALDDAFPKAAPPASSEGEAEAGAEVAAPIVVVHPSAGKVFRRWPTERFAAVADELIERTGARVVIIGTPGERELGEQIRMRMRHPAAAAYLALPVVDLLALYERAAVIVSNESGPTHLAATTELPIVTIFGPTREAHWRPLRDERTVLLRGAECDPGCGRRVCVAEHRCLQALSTRCVLDHALATMRSPTGPERV